MQDKAMSALPPKSDIGVGRGHFRYGPMVLIKSSIGGRGC
jgi:hypothetical protein